MSITPVTSVAAVAVTLLGDILRARVPYAGKTVRAQGDLSLAILSFNISIVAEVDLHIITQSI